MVQVRATVHTVSESFRDLDVADRKCLLPDEIHNKVYILASNS